MWDQAHAAYGKFGLGDKCARATAAMRVPLARGNPRHAADGVARIMETAPLRPPRANLLQTSARGVRTKPYRTLSRSLWLR